MACIITGAKEKVRDDVAERCSTMAGCWGGWMDPKTIFNKQLKPFIGHCDIRSTGLGLIKQMF